MSNFGLVFAAICGVLIIIVNIVDMYNAKYNYPAVSEKATEWCMWGIGIGVFIAVVSFIVDLL